MKIFKRRLSVAAWSGIIALGVVRSGHAQVNLVTDGEFESFTTTGAPNSGGLTTAGGQLGYDILDSSTSGPWINTTQSGGGTYGYNFIMTTAAANSTGVTGNGGALALWNKSVDGNGVSYTGQDNIPAPPEGGNILADDPVYEESAVTQVIKGLTSGTKYNLYFYYAGAQQSGSSFTSTTTEYWQVSLSTSSSTTTATTAVINNAAESFTGWDLENLQFTASATSETLSFLAEGGPSGLPPFALLSDVYLVVAPEPSTVFAGAFLLLPMGIGVVRMFRKKAPKQV